jgi:uncharacterized membrane protein
LKKLDLLHYACIVSLIGLIFLCLVWEGWLAPLRPGGSALVLKVLPLLLPLFGILRGKIYTYQWASMLILLYFAEGLLRALTDKGASVPLALAETALSLVFFFGSIFYVRFAARANRGKIARSDTKSGDVL